jgi:hypothetical protein
MTKKQMRPPLAEHVQFLNAYESEIGELTLAVRALVLQEAPESTELIYDGCNAVASGYSFTGRPSDAFIHIAAYAKWVNLGFNQGKELDDPDGLLAGTGNAVRHIRISTVADLKKPAVQKLVKAAIVQARREAARGPANGLQGKSVVRAIYPTRRRPVKGLHKTLE